jgi:hypothetical protein
LGEILSPDFLKGNEMFKNLSLVVALTFAIMSTPAFALGDSEANANGVGVGTATGNTVGDTNTNAEAVTGPVTTGSAAGAQNEVTFEGTQIPRNTEAKIKAAPSVMAPGLTTTLTETCMGSTSTGISGMGFGVSFGTTWRDSACVRRLDAREIRSFGDADVAKEIMCDSENVRKAYARANKPCAADRQ